MTGAGGRRFAIFSRRHALGSMVITALMTTAAAAAEPTDAGVFIQTLGERTVAVLRDPSLATDVKVGRLVTLLDEATDLPLVARLVLGRYWREATEPQRREYVELFEAIIVKNMAQRLNRYGGGSFRIVDRRAADEKDSMVATEILAAPGSVPTRVDWRVREAGGRFAVVDIVVEGVSMVVTHRSEASDIVARQGIEGLLAAMRQRLDRPA